MLQIEVVSNTTMMDNRSSDSTKSQHKHNRIVHGTKGDTKATKDSSSDDTKPGVDQATQHSSCSEDDVPAIPVTSTSKSLSASAFKITIAGQKGKELPVSSTKRPSNLIAKAFNPDEDSDEEEMPPEAKMRMRNLGKDTRAAEGPNSFSKGKMGFCNKHKMMMRELDHGEQPFKK